MPKDILYALTVALWIELLLVFCFCGCQIFAVQFYGLFFSTA